MSFQWAKVPALLFAVGNVVVEGLLILYVFRSGNEPEVAVG